VNSTTISEPTWAVACAGTYGIPAMSGSPLMAGVRPVGGEAALGAPAVRPRHTAVRHVALAPRKQGRSVFTVAPISQQAQAHRLNVAVTDRYVAPADNKVWGPSPWRPPSV